jgi:hypothetical protein
MDAEEIKNKAGDGVKRRVSQLIDAMSVAKAQLLHGLRCFRRADRLIDHFHAAIRVFFDNVVILLLPLPGIP